MSGFSVPSRYIPTNVVVPGGFSLVGIYLDTHLDRRVAIKSLRSALEASRLNDEIGALLRIRSDHVIQVFDVIHQGQAVAIIEEFVDGHDLLAEGPYRHDAAQYLRYVWQLAAGIRDIHACGLIHRDIKPNNVLVDSNGVVKIIDFGLSRATEENARTQGFVGTFGFAAPELFLDGEVEFTQAIDIFAFGATAIFIGAGVLPPELNRASRPLPLAFDSLPHFSFDVPEECRRTILQCLSTDARDRPTAAEVCAVFAKYILHGRHQALSVSNSRSFRLSSSNRRIRWAYGDIGAFAVEYDGFEFKVIEASGEVFANNAPLSPSTVLVGSCVIAIGGAERRANQRAFITFDVSHPEVMA